VSAAATQRTQSQWVIILTDYTLFVIVTLRAIITYALRPALPPLLALLRSSCCCSPLSRS